MSGDPLLASAPGGLSPVNQTPAPLQAQSSGPPPPQDEVSTLACGARDRLPHAPGVWSPLKATCG